MRHHCSQFGTNHSIANSSIFTSKNIGCETTINADSMRERGDRPLGFINGLLKAAHLHRPFRVEISPAFCQLQGE